MSHVTKHLPQISSGQKIPGQIIKMKEFHMDFLSQQTVCWQDGKCGSKCQVSVHWWINIKALHWFILLTLNSSDCTKFTVLLSCLLSVMPTIKAQVSSLFT
jgi:hypothetical protein